MSKVINKSDIRGIFIREYMRTPLAEPFSHSSARIRQIESNNVDHIDLADKILTIFMTAYNALRDPTGRISDKGDTEGMDDLEIYLYICDMLVVEHLIPDDDDETSFYLSNLATVAYNELVRAESTIGEGYGIEKLLGDDLAMFTSIGQVAMPQPLLGVDQ